MLVYTVLSFFAYGIYSFVTDTIRISQVSNIDRALVELGTGASFTESINSFEKKNHNLIEIVIQIFFTRCY